ncbi:50S ribosomal protein L19e [Candidatus Woesearchaeota archaeon]|nr:50S ribosomal protein L19e [Candidatus Woesearchaeota archaeon]
MKLNSRKETIARMLGVGKSRVFIDSSKLKEVKEAITKADLRGLVKNGIVEKKPKIGISRGRIRKRILLKRHGRTKGIGKRKGNRTARNPSKLNWIIKIRNLRKLLKILKLKKLITTDVYRKLYLMSKGGFFKNRRHLKTYIEERGLIKK